MPIIIQRFKDLVAAGPILRVVVGLSAAQLEAMDVKARDWPKYRRSIYAMIDTGCQRTVVSPEVLESIGALPVDERRVVGVGGLVTMACCYEVAVQLSPEIEVGSVEVVGVATTMNGLGALIERDVLASMELLYEGPKNRFTLTA